MITRDRFLSEARKWVGVPWVHQGRNRHGVDCIGLLLVTCWALGLTEYDVRGYGRVPDGDFMRRECDRLMERALIPQPGDVMVMRFSREPQHVLIRTERGALHAWAVPGRVVEVTMPDAWSRRIVAAYRVPGVA
jgi:cell wall-associated NlpC family hydrolase